MSGRASGGRTLRAGVVGHLHLHGGGAAERGDAREVSVRPGGVVASVVLRGGGERHRAHGRLGGLAAQRRALHRRLQTRAGKNGTSNELSPGG